MYSSIRRNHCLTEKGFKWIGAVHEYLEVYGNILTSNIAISHIPLSHDTNEIFKFTKI